MIQVRVLVWNVHGFRAGVRAVGDVIRDASPDVVLLNEARFRRRLGRLARDLGMASVSGLRWPRPVTNAVLARPPWRMADSSTTRLTRTRRLKCRGVILARLRCPGLDLVAACVHLGVADGERARHARELTDILAAAPRPLVLGGDLNESPGGRSARWIADRYWDAFSDGEGEGFTFSSVAPRARIDYLFVSEGVRVAGARVLEDPRAVHASDHLPLVADLELEG